MLNIIQNTIGAIRRVGESVVRAGLKMWLPFTKADVGATTQTTPDISGNDNNAILKTGKCLTFTGNDSVQTAFPSSKDIKTIAFWIYPTHSSTDEVVFYFGDAAGGDKYIDLDHLVMESDANNNINFDVYIDGVLRGETNYGGNNPTLTINQWQRVVLTTDTAINTTNDKFYIAHKENGAFGRFKMSDLQIYGADWTTDDIAYDYANPQKLVTDNASSNVTLNDLHAWWHMSEGDGTIAFDSAPLIGKELVVNGDFSTDSDWIEGVGWDIDVINNIAVCDGTQTGNSSLQQSGIASIGKIYKVKFDLTVSAGYIQYVNLGGWIDNTDLTTSGTYTYYTDTTTATNNLGIAAASNFIGSIDNVSVKEVFNIDGETYDGSSLGATYDDAQERIPQLGMMNWSKGSNLIEYSEDITLANGYGKNTAVTLESNAGVSPIGTGNATKMSNPSGYGIFYNTQSLDAAETYTFSFYVKNINATDLKYRVYNNTTQSDLISATSYYSQTSTDEWVRVSITFTTTNSANYNCYLNSGTSGGSALFWGAQLEESSSATAYRRTNGTAVTDATLISCATDSQKDILGNAVRVKGSGFNLDGTGYAEITEEIFDVGTGAFTISAWAKYKFVYQNSSHNAIFVTGTGLGFNSVASLSSTYPDTTNRGFLFRIGQETIGTNHSVSLVEGNWYHVVGVKKADGDMNLYVNGNLQDDTEANSDSLRNDQNKYIGEDADATYDRFYHERIDDVKFYNRELSSDEIEQNYNATKSGHNN